MLQCVPWYTQAILFLGRFLPIPTITTILHCVPWYSLVIFYFFNCYILNFIVNRLDHSILYLINKSDFQFFQIPPMNSFPCCINYDDIAISKGFFLAITSHRPEVLAERALSRSAASSALPTAPPPSLSAGRSSSRSGSASILPRQTRHCRATHGAYGGS
jgi:hypothetical protein